MKIIHTVRRAVAWAALKLTFRLTGEGHVSRALLSIMRRWNANAEYEELSELAMRNPHASRGLRLISQLMDSVPLYVEKRNDNGEWETPERHEFGHVLGLVDRPAPRMSRQQLLDLVVVASYAGGEFWIDGFDDGGERPLTGRNSLPDRLRLILPDEFRDFIRDEETEEVIGYRFATRIRGRQYARTVKQCQHVIICPNPTDPDRGYPILLAGQSLALMQAATSWNESIAQGGGRVPKYWVPNKEDPGEMMDPVEAQRAEDLLNEKDRAAALRNAHRVLLGNLRPVEGDVSPKDADWVRGQELSLRQVAVLLGIPATLLGGEKQGSLTDAGVDSEVRATYMLTVLPLLERVLTELSRFFMPPEYRLWYDRDQIEALQEDTNAIWTRYREAFEARGITRNEYRDALGLEMLPGPEHDEIQAAPDPFGDLGGDGQVRVAPPIMKLAELPEAEFERMFTN